MLRSMMIGLAVAALLQLAGHALTPVNNISLTAQRIDWVTAQAKGVAKLFSNGYALLPR